jgi:Lysylphosphatidylglycerol synthase TM region
MTGWNDPSASLGRPTTDSPQRTGDEEGAEAAGDARRTSSSQMGVSDGAPEMSLVRRLRQPRTIASIVIPVALLALAVVALPGFHVDRTWAAITRANPWLLGGALLAYYASFPIRGYRWRRLLAAAGMETSNRDATEILFLSWFVNCLVPAKLGDVYRAYRRRLSRLPASLTERPLGERCTGHDPCRASPRPRGYRDPWRHGRLRELRWGHAAGRRRRIAHRLPDRGRAVSRPLHAA